MKPARLAAIALLAVACTRIVEDPGAQPSGTPSSASPTATATGPTIDAPIFFVIEQRGRLFLVPEVRQLVESSPGVGRMMELIVGEPHDPDLSSPWPNGARVRGVQIEHGTAIVDLSVEALTADVGAEMEQLGIQAAVHTLTEMAGVDRLQFTIEGRSAGEASNGRQIEDWWGHVGLAEQPFEPDDELLAPVTIESPEEGATVPGTFTVSGEASVFEANVILRTRDETGAEIRRSFATATIGAPGRGTWEKRLTLPNQPGRYTIEAVEVSEEDGTDVFVMSRVVILA